MKAPDDDAALIRRCRLGDSSAFGILVRKYQDPLFNGVYRMVGDYQDAADVVQDVFLKAYRAIDTFRGSAAFYTWLYTIAVNTCRSRGRSLKARKEHVPLAAGTGGDPDDDPPSGNDPTDPEPLPSEVAETREEYCRAEEALQRLPHDSRMVVVLKDIEGRNYTEIAAMMQISLGTVKSRLFRAREKLREMLTD
ncbi:MAG TPA: sigma-70 family RNA polymerase sigma factor [Planctomycetota bacterium]|nr:sigma-70 family RNA polymerase sigma factor [Planctomycetota bacterium]